MSELKTCKDCMCLDLKGLSCLHPKNDVNGIRKAVHENSPACFYYKENIQPQADLRGNTTSEAAVEVADNFTKVGYDELREGMKGIAIGEEEFFLAVRRTKKGWRFKMFDLRGDRRPLTAWITINDAESLRVVKAAEVLRGELKGNYGDRALSILEGVIGVIQENEDRWPIYDGEKGSEVSPNGRSSERERQVDPEAVKQAQTLLLDPLLLCKIAEALHEGLGLVGETKNGLLTYLDLISSKLEDPGNLRYSGRAGVGKTAIVTKVAQLFPPEDLIIRGGLTKKSLYYLPEAKNVDENTKLLPLKGKALIILEESESWEFLNEAKPLLSHDVPVLKYSFVDEKVTRTVLLEGWPAYIGVTTVPMSGEEHETRTLLASPDRGKEKYGAVVADDAKRRSLPWLSPKLNLEPWQELVRQIKPLKVWTPWLKVVSKHFPTDKAGSMRNWKKFCTYLEAVVLLHQHQRPHVTIKGEEYVIACPLDLEIMVKIVEAAMAETVLGLERDVKDFYEAIKAEGEKPHTCRELMGLYERTFGEPISRTTIRDRFISKLLEIGLLEEDESEKAHKFSVNSENLTHLADLNNALIEVKSDQTKHEMVNSDLWRLEGVQRLGMLDEVEKTYAYTLSNFHTLEELLSRSKEEEYNKTETESETAKSVRCSFEKKPELGGMPNGEMAGKQAQEREPSGDTAVIETAEKIDVILQLIDQLEALRGSANLDELERLAEKELGIDHSDFGTLISYMRRGGAIVATEDEQGVRRAGPKPPSKGETAAKGPAGQNEEKFICYLCHPPTDQGSRDGLRTHYRLAHGIKEIK